MAYQDIRVEELETLLSRDDLVIIDMRDEQSRTRGMLPGALVASDSVISGLMRRRRSDPPVLVYCYHGNTSRDLCSLLTGFGLSRVYNLEGGWAAWEAADSQHTSLTAQQQNWLISHGFDPRDLHSRVEMGMSPLMLAALQGNRPMVQALMDAGTDPNLQNDDEHHALWFACVNGDPLLVQTLIDYGCHIDNRNVNGVTCAIYAASTGKLEVLRRLVNAGANLCIRTHDGYDALDSASTLPVLRFLRPLMLEPLPAAG